MMMGKFPRYWHTLKHLRPVQLYRWVWFRLNRPRLNASAIVLPLRVSKGDWQRSTMRAVSMLGPTKFRFLNQTLTLPLQGDWDNTGIEKLWLYNLHYFDDLNASKADERIQWHQEWIKRWIINNPPALGSGWEPYPTSLRIVNWVKWLGAGNSAVPGMLESLALQAGWLAKRLEWHLLGNHLFANAKALVFAGLFFEGPEATAWLNTGIKIIIRELPEQVLADGGNFERSPMYHAIFLEDLLDLVNAATNWNSFVPYTLVSRWRDTAKLMLGWLSGMTHPDGEIGLFNDAAFRIAPQVSELQRYAKTFGIESPYNSTEVGARLLHYPDSGYVRLHSQAAVALLDVAPIGPDYLPGHAHADTLSFELSVAGQRVVVNGGTSRYGLGPERLRERGTAAHSTVVLAGQNSSEVWSGFRVARRAYPFDLQLQDGAGVMKVACSHDGYKRLPGAPVHRREWVMDAGSLQVSDAVCGGTHTAFARYILHPSVTVVPVGSNAWQLTLAGAQNLRVVVSAGLGRIEPASYAPEFGIVLHTKCLAVELTQGQAHVEWFWT
jgi:uncharacterized heparinase superfamily protein